MLQERIRTEMVTAMKAGDKEKKTSLSMILAALKNKEIDKRTALTEQDELDVIAKMVKQCKESIEMTPANRTETLEKLNKELELYEMFLPKQMTKEEISDVIKNVLTELNIEQPTKKEKGIIMRSLMPKVKGKADGKLVNNILETFFV